MNGLSAEKELAVRVHSSLRVTPAMAAGVDERDLAVAAFDRLERSKDLFTQARNVNTQGGRSRMKSLGAEGAFLRFDRLREDKTVLFCSGELFGFSLTMRGRVSALSKEKVEIGSLDGEAAISLGLVSDGMTFEYCEARDFPALSHLPDELRSCMSLVAGFPDRGFMPRRERIAFIELAS